MLNYYFFGGQNTFPLQIYKVLNIYGFLISKQNVAIGSGIRVTTGSVAVCVGGKGRVGTTKEFAAK